MDDAIIQVTGGDEIAELGDLWEWLRGERALAGRIQAQRREPGDNELGGVLDALVVVLGSGSTTAVLARSLTTWIKSRRSSVVVKVTTTAGTIELDAHNLAAIDDVLPLLRQIMPEDGHKDD